MGNGISMCFSGPVEARRAHDLCMVDSSYDEGLGHSFCYVRPDPTRLHSSGSAPCPPSSKIHSEESAAAAASIFRSISGASVSANTSTPLSTAFVDSATVNFSAAFFESSTSFASCPLQPIPRSGPMSGTLGPGSGPLTDHGFMSGPLDRSGGFMSGPLDRAGPAFSGPLDRSFSVNGGGGYGKWSNIRRRRRAGGGSLIRGLRRAISRTFRQSSVVAPVKGLMGHDNWIIGGGPQDKINPTINNNNTNDCNIGTVSGSLNMSPEMSIGDSTDDSSWESQNLQWAQGKAGEDRVHVVVSEERGWVFVGIYDGFSGPDATDFLLSNLYGSVQKELKGLLWDDNNNNNNNHNGCCKSSSSCCSSSSSFIKTCCSSGSVSSGSNSSRSTSSSSSDFESCDISDQIESCGASSVSNGGKKGRNSRSKLKGANKKWEENQRRWKCEWDRERLELDRRLKEQWTRNEAGGGGQAKQAINHSDVLKALAGALKKTEEAYLDIADKMLDENPELALMGSCVLAMLMKGEDVYVMNVGDSRAVLAQTKEPDLRLGKVDQDLERINEESMYDFEVSDGVRCNLRAFQLTVDHSTSVEEEVQRIRDEHPDDPIAIVNDRVKGSLKVTRAFGAGFLKQKKWNDALLEMFRIDYAGDSPYINCLPFLYHHRLGPKDQFLILSSDGLYQYFTNEEAVAEVELFISLSPEGDPAQHLVEEVLFRAAKRAGMDFYELLEIPQGDRRRYHDDVSIIVISFEGRIWRSCV